VIIALYLPHLDHQLVPGRACLLFKVLERQMEKRAARARTNKKPLPRNDKEPQARTAAHSRRLNEALRQKKIEIPKATERSQQRPE